MILAMSGTDCRMTRMIRARGSTAMHTCTRRRTLWQSLSGVPLGPSQTPSPHCHPTCPDRQNESPTDNHHPHLFPRVQAGPLLFSRIPSSPEGVGDRVDIEFINEESQEQDKDDKEVEDVPAVLGGRVGQPQQGLSGPAHEDILGLPSPHPKDEGFKVLLTAMPVICHPLLLFILLLTKHATQQHALTVSYMCKQPSAVSETHSGDSHTYG